MVTLLKLKEFTDGTANYNWNADAEFIKYYVNCTSQPVTDELVGEFLTKIIHEACGESYTKADRDFVKFKGE